MLLLLLPFTGIVVECVQVVEPGQGLGQVEGGARMMEHRRVEPWRRCTSPTGGRAGLPEPVWRFHANLKGSIVRKKTFGTYFFVKNTGVYETINTYIIKKHDSSAILKF